MVQSDEVVRFKQQQDAIARRRSALRDSVKQCHHAIQYFLDKLIEDAQAAGLKGTKACEVQTDDEKLRIIAFELNHRRGVLLSTNDVLNVSLDQLDEVGKIFVFPDREDAYPLFEIVFSNTSITMTRFSIEGTESYSTNLTSDLDEAGREAALTIFTTYYRIIEAWPKRPTLGGLSSGEATTKHALGFTLPK